MVKLAENKHSTENKPIEVMPVPAKVVIPLIQHLGKICNPEVKVGDIVEGEVKRIQPFGAFVEVAPGKDGLVHVSKMSTEFVKDPGQVVKLGQKVKVKVVQVDETGRISLSMVFGQPKEVESVRPDRREKSRRSVYRKSR